jgi:ribosomal protein S18 acetylase RimI-like enzyme
LIFREFIVLYIFMNEIEQIDFRPATFDDYAVLSEMLIRSFLWRNKKKIPEPEVFRCGYPLETRAFVDGFGLRTDDAGVIAEITGNPVGAAWARHIDRKPPYNGELIPDHSYEIAIAVHPDVRRRRIGMGLLQHLSDMAANQGNEYLMLGVKEDNIPARRLYEQCDFEVYKDESGKEVRVYGGVTIPMIKNLVK